MLQICTSTLVRCALLTVATGLGALAMDKPGDMGEERKDLPRSSSSWLSSSSSSSSSSSIDEAFPLSQAPLPPFGTPPPVPQVRLPSDYPAWAVWRQIYGTESADRAFGPDLETVRAELAAVGIPLDQMAGLMNAGLAPRTRTGPDGIQTNEPADEAHQRATLQVTAMVLKGLKGQPQVERRLQFE